MNQDTYTDAGQPIPREICTRNVRMGGNDIYILRLLLEVETGVGQGSLGLEVSRNGGRTFGPQKSKVMGPVGAYLTRTVFNRLGFSKDFVLRIRMTDPIRFVISSGSVDYEASV